MHLFKTARVVLLLANHLVATHAALPFITSPHPDLGLKGVDLVQRMITPNHVSLEPSEMRAPRAISCERYNKCKRNKIRDSKRANGCKKCPRLMTPNAAQSKCIKDKNVKDEDKRKTYKDSIQERKKEKMKEFNNGKNLKDRISRKKEVKQADWDRKDSIRRNGLNIKRSQRMAQCLPLVAAAIGTQEMLEMADGGFSEDLLSSIDMDMLELWPSEMDDNWTQNLLPDDMHDINNEDFANGFLEIGDAADEKRKRSVTRVDIDEVIEAGDASSEHPVQKRGIFDGIIQAFATIARVIGQAAARLAGKAGQAAARVSKFFKDRKPNLKKAGESKWSRADQKAKAKEVSKNKNWSKCLKGEKPEK